jgi:predicted GNAT family acetyltransferase
MAFLARLDGRPVGAGLYTTPFDGLTEVTGLATSKPFRRRGIATALTALAVQTAFEQGVEAVYLTAADERAGRVYERVGFRRFVTMLAYIEARHKLKE